MLSIAYELASQPPAIALELAKSKLERGEKVLALTLLAAAAERGQELTKDVLAPFAATFGELEDLWRKLGLPAPGP